MFIQTEATPNPATLKFLPGLRVMETGSAEFRSIDEAEASPLAQSLFGIDGVAGVFLGDDFISVTKADGEWHHLKPMILGAIMEHFTAGRPVLAAGADASAGAVGGDAPQFDEDDREIVDQIIELLDTRVRPAVAQDGGDISFQGFDKGVVYLHMRGACAGCPSSTMTLKNGIERLLQHFVPEVNEVRQVY
jgi:Fe-S cluster biogenesis protein NfuA